jgi:ribosomal-protein-alanine N-acetyltransferase
MRYEIRKWKLEDAAGFAKYASNENIARNLRDGFPFPFPEETAKKMIQSFLDNDGKNQCSRAICIDGEAVGNIAVFFRDDIYRKSGEIAYWLGEPFWKKGIMSSAIKQICEYVFANYDICRISAEPIGYNIGSQKALLKAGFELEGVLRKSVFKNGEIHDSHLYALVK